MIIYHITSHQAWEQAKQAGQYTAPSLSSEGFIHASTIEQVIGTANLLFNGAHDLVLLVIQADSLTHPLRFDSVTSHGDVQEFPHIYGPINLSAVVEVIEFPSGLDGTFKLPPSLTRHV